MLIKSVTIRNFRCIKQLSVEFAALTAFVGRNGSGKSTILQALNAFYNIRAALSEYDFFDSDTTVPIEIMIEFGDLNPEEKERYSSHLDGETFAVTKKVFLENGKLEQKYYAAVKQIPAISDVRRARGTTDKRNQWNQLVDEGSLPEIGPKSIRGDDPDAVMDAYEKLHPELAEWIPQEVQFLGPPNIGGGSLDKYTKFVYIPAVRDASDDSVDKKGSLLFHLLDLLVMRRFRARQDVRTLQSEFTGRLKDLYDPEKLTEFNELASEISKTLKVYIPNAQLELRVTEPNLPEIPNPATIAELIEDEYAGSIDRKGHGLQRALIFALLQHLAVAQPLEPLQQSEAKSEIEGELSGSTTDPGGADSQPTLLQVSTPDLIIAIEEPELYQHPLRARYLAQILLNMSRESSIGPGGRNQVLYTTHSPYFVDLARFDQLRIVRKYKLVDGEPPCTSVARYSLQSAAEKMAGLTGGRVEQFTADSFRARTHPVLTQIVNEGFFAEGVVLVEGETETAALLTVANQLNDDWISRGIAIVPVGGKTKIDRAAVVFTGFQIPTYIVFDADCRHKGGNKERNSATTNRLLLRLCGATEEDFPLTVACTKHACFEDDFESYCKHVVGETEYRQLLENAATAYGYDKPSDGIKNFDVVVELVNGIYDAGHRLIMLEEIVGRVNQIVTQVNSPINAEDAVPLEDSA